MGWLIAIRQQPVGVLVGAELKRGEERRKRRATYEWAELFEDVRLGSKQYLGFAPGNGPRQSLTTVALSQSHAHQFPKGLRCCNCKFGPGPLLAFWLASRRL